MFYDHVLNNVVTGVLLLIKRKSVLLAAMFEIILPAPLVLHPQITSYLLNPLKLFF